MISADKVIRQAEAFGHSIKREFCFLVAHSMLHLLGYDHMIEEEARVMEEKQESCLAALGIEIDRHSIELEKPLKKSGTYEVAAKLHAQVTATVKVVLVVKGEKVEETPAEEA